MTELNAWGQVMTCRACDRRLPKHKGSGRPREYCAATKCQAVCRQRQRQRAAGRKRFSYRCPTCGEPAAFPHLRSCPVRAEASL